MRTKPLFNKLNRVLAAVLLLAALAVGQTVWGMQIFIHPQTGSNFTLEVEQTDGTEAIKAKIEERIGVSSNYQHLYYNNAELEDGHTLSDYNIQAESTLNLIYDGWANLQEQLTNSSTNATDPTVITLECDIVAESTDSYLNIPAGHHVIIDLNSHKIDRNLTEGQQYGYVIKLAGASTNHASLVIRDSSNPSTGMITGGFDGTSSGGSYAGGIDNLYGDLTLESGSICGNKCTFSGGGGVWTGGGTFTMTGGTITGNVVNTLKGSPNAGGAIFGNSGVIYLLGGSITGNTAYSNSGGQTSGGITPYSGAEPAKLHLSGTFTLSGNQKIMYDSNT